MSKRFLRNKKNKSKETEGPDVPSAAQVLMEVDVESRVISKRELEHENKEAKQQLREVTAEKETLEAKINNMPTLEQLEEQRARNETLELDYRDKVRSLEDELEQLKNQARAELEDLHSEIDADQSHHARMQAELTTELEETKRKLRKKTREVKKLKEANDALREEMKSSVNSTIETEVQEVPSESKEEQEALVDKIEALDSETKRLRDQLSEVETLYENSKAAVIRVKEVEKQLHDLETKHITELNNLAVEHRSELLAKDQGIAQIWETQLEESLNKVFVQFEEKEKRLHRVIKERDDQLVKLRQEMLNKCEEMGELLVKERHISTDILQKWDEYRRGGENRSATDLSPSPKPMEAPSGRSLSQTDLVESVNIKRGASRSMAAFSSRPPPPDFRAPRRTKIQDIGKNLWSKFAATDSRQNYNLTVGDLPNGPRYRIMQLMIRQTELEQSLLTAERNVVLVNERSNAKTRQLELTATKAQGNQEREILRMRTQLQLQQRATKSHQAAVQKSLSEQRILREMLLTIESEAEIFNKKSREQGASIQRLTKENTSLKQHVKVSQGDFVAKESVMLKAHSEVERLKSELDETRNNYKTIQGRQVQNDLEAEKNEIAINRNRALQKEVRHLKAKNKDLKAKLQKLTFSLAQKKKSPFLGRKKMVNKRAAIQVEEEHESDIETSMTPLEIGASNARSIPKSEFVAPEQTRSRRGDYEDINGAQEDDLLLGSANSQEEIYRSDNSLDERRGRCKAVISSDEGTAL